MLLRQQPENNGSKKPQRSLPVQFRKILQFFGLFFGKSGIHGFAYLVKSYLTYLEKFLWFVLLIVSLYFCIDIAMESLHRYNTKSTVIAIEKDHYYWNTTTPSLTICPLERLNKQKFKMYCREKGITGARQNQFWAFMESLANSTYINFQNIQPFDSLDELNIQSKDYMKLIYSLTDDKTLSSDKNTWIRTHNDLKVIRSRQVLTEYGLCYMTNNYLTEELSSKYLIFGEPPEDNKYWRDNPVYPVRLSNLFDGEITYNFIGFNSAITVFIHSVYESMQIDHSYGYTKEAMEFETNSVDIVTTDDFEKSTSVEQRHCRFIHESNLTHYPALYTKNICLQECRLRLAYKLCKCIPHFYPNLIAEPKPVCSYRQLMNCFPKHEQLFLHLYTDDDNGGNVECNCLQNCKDSKIIVEKSQTMGNSKDLLGSVGGLIIVKRYPLIRYQRQIIFTFTDLLVSIGGTAGLFLGFSVLGAVEIIYYFTLRFFWYLRGYKE